ncbi:hypothetical protein SA19142_19780 [Staphylococcus argenteus]|nr:hypothetical protein SARG0275_00550 [Staphylococcus argenteus]GBU02798.1 hypothetical protein SARG0275_18790 [Staphylococcus argenteus]GJF37170.1 hypothetical protein SA19023_19250 [Staphylococcus argenteus]GJF70778.1 hypothetical protein SA19142_19780 [Staphylococcus argenteus]GJF81408.1 hypothetical protein SA19252_23710 [Staphylococcus argenteus]
MIESASLNIDLDKLISFKLKGKLFSINKDFELKLNVTSINKYIIRLVIIVTFI